MSLRDSEAPLSPMPSPPKPPCPWPEMLVDWTRLALALGRIAGHPILLGAAPKDIGDLAMDTWRWMWSLPPCSEARKAAWTLGAAALLIERWRKDTDPAEDEDRGPCTRGRSARNGLRARALLHIATWHVEDARGARIRARTLGHEPTIPAHERLYKVASDGLLYGIVLGGTRTGGQDLARRILADHFEHQSGPIKGDPVLLGKAFDELAIASLPDGPWVMTTRDVTRFLDFIQENEL